MEKLKKWAKALAPAGGSLWTLFILSFLFWPDRNGLEWLPGWPEFLGHTFYFLPIVPLLPILIVAIWRSPLNEKLTKQKKNISVALLIVCNIVIVGVIAGFTQLSFFGYQKVDRFIVSPNGRNKAVVLAQEFIPGFPDQEDIYPVRKSFRYKRDDGIDINPNCYDVSLVWQDDNTLAITRTWTGETEDGGAAQPETEYLRW